MPGDSAATPQDAVIHSTDSQLTRLKTGETLEAVANVRLTGASLWVSGEAVIDGETLFARTWYASAPGA